MAEPGLLIIGASQAGVQLAVSLRTLGHTGPITLVGEENHRPYQRPPLSKEFLRGSVTEEKLIHRTGRFWEDNDIRVVTGERIVRVDKDADGSGVAHAASGTTFPFDRLALTVGARARDSGLDGSDLPGVLSLRDADDALELKSRAPAASDVVVIGGGFIGLEAAASLRSMGKRVTVLEAGPRLVGRAVGPETSEYLLKRHTELGIEVVRNARVTRIVSGGDAVGGVQVDGRFLAADLVLVGVGAVPNTELAESLGLDCRDGIRVDEYAVTSDGVTVAAGDCTNLPNPFPEAPDGDRIRFESVNNAIEQAKVAAHTLTGDPRRYTGVPWFWSNQGDLKLQIAGLSSGYDRALVRHDAERGRFSVLYYRGDRVIAADCVNAPLDFLAVKNALAARSTIPYDRAADPAVALKALTVGT
ncbi:NAD(P)/FAD-dependent oxidoreductase [Saccharomonospora iraqiensis]|uniref:NAD(P)/FAD-dependent oxidoreductase n=1 Tax=Saccharomonospora iraqiensis TaxID=52698 RepID=UPI00040D1BF4|nr:FAD-dependent oxidoreductase [Saccharomonospora iraqiensis]